RMSRGDLYSVGEIAALAHLPLDRDIPGVSRAGARVMPAPPELTERGKLLGDSAYPPHRPVRLAPDDACQHLHLIGATGTGKSTLLANLILDDIAARRGTLVLDPKGDLVNDVLARLPDDAVDRVVLIDPEAAGPPGLNVLAGADVHLAVDQVVGVMRRLFASAWGPRTDDILRAACLTLRQHQGANLAQIPRLLTDPAYRAPLVAGVNDPVLRGFWRSYDAMSEAAQQAAIAPVTNKLRAFLLRPFVRDLVGTGTSSFSLTRVLDGGVLLARLPKGILGDETVRLLGSLLVAQVWQAAAGRARTGQGRVPASLYLDECQNFLALPGSLDDILAEARGYGLGLVLAHQYLGQLGDLAEVVSANARSKVFFACSPEDARRLERHVLPDLTAHDLAHPGRHQAAARLVVAGQDTPAFTLRTRPAPPPVLGRAQQARERSFERFGLSGEQRRVATLAVEGSWVGRSPADGPDDGPDGFKLPGLSDADTAGGGAG
ncbi:MAG: type IV secretory system conjugative DNA transfer family protein, partial [Mycobacteriales bacterium]